MKLKINSVEIRDLLWKFRHGWMIEKRSNDGLGKHPLCNTWYNMLDRCYNPNSQGFRLYGARGIEVCDRWMLLKNFIDDMGDNEGLTLDRIDSDKGYSKDNCRWASRTTQSRNVRESTKRRRTINLNWVMKHKKAGHKLIGPRLPSCCGGGV